jgi:hypothetical protein
MEKQIVEINGIKMEVDMRHATRIDTLVVGSKVKVLIKSDYSAPEVKSGVVVGFEAFKDLPTIIVCYLNISYSEAKLEFAYINSDSAKKYDIVLSVDEELPVEKSDVLSRMDKEIAKKHEEIADIERKRDYFLKNFDHYFAAA